MEALAGQAERRELHLKAPGDLSAGQWPALLGTENEIPLFARP